MEIKRLNFLPELMQGEQNQQACHISMTQKQITLRKQEIGDRGNLENHTSTPAWKRPKSSERTQAQCALVIQINLTYN